MSTQANKEMVRHYFDERWNHGNLEVYDAMLAPSLDIVRWKESTRSMYTALGNIHLQILSILAEGDQVAVHWRLEAIHQGEFLGVQATGKLLTYQGIALIRIVDSKIIDDIAYWDILEILNQLGVALTNGK